MPGGEHWVLQNSWSQTWGDNGFFRLAVTGGVGVCGVNRVVQFVDPVLPWAGP